MKSYQFRKSILCGFLLTVAMFSSSSEGIFFQFPKRAVMNFLESLGGKKQPPPIHHIHRHYYPIPLPVLLPKPAPLPPPPQIEIDLTAYHSAQDFGKLFDGEGKTSSSTHAETPWSSPLPESWPGTTARKSWNAWENNELQENGHAYSETKSTGIFLQTPLRQQIILYQPPAKDTKTTLLSTFFKKIRRLNDALFHPEEEDCPQPLDNKPRITNSLTYGTVS